MANGVLKYITKNLLRDEIYIRKQILRQTLIDKKEYLFLIYPSQWVCQSLKIPAFLPS